MRFASPSRRRTARFLLAVSVVIGVGGVGPLASGADQTVTFTVAARADAMSVEAVDAQAPVVPGGQVFFASPSSTQALVDSVGTSAGFASAPYPGDTAATGAGTVSGFTGTPVPAYPFYVTSSWPTAPSAANASGPFSVESKSSAADTVARAHVQFPPGDANAAAFTSEAASTAGRQAGSGALVAEATTLVQGLSVGPDLAIGTIAARARLSGAPGAKPAKETSFSVGTITFAGATFGLTDKGFQPVGAIPTVAPTDELKAQGITLRFLPARDERRGTRRCGRRSSSSSYPATGTSWPRPQPAPRRSRGRGERASTTAATSRSAAGPRPFGAPAGW